VARNDLEVELLRRAYATSVRLHSVVFELRTRSPLSWHLSQADLRVIDADWKRPHNRAERERAGAILRGDVSTTRVPADRPEAPLQRELR
jgi:hypothetical protein